LLLGVGSEAITNRTFYLIEILADMIYYSDIQMGGENIIVKVDETKLGKRKYNRGHRIEEELVIGCKKTLPKFF
jgi:hypothetical protein